MSDMSRGPDNVEEGPIGRVEVKISELKAMSKDILELSMGIESFLLGDSPMASSEKSDKKTPSGWLDILSENLDETKDTLGIALNCLIAVKSTSK